MADDNQEQGSAPLVTVAQQAVIAINGLTLAVKATFPNFVTVPANSTASGVAGQVAYDNTHFYWCVSANSWICVTGSAF